MPLELGIFLGAKHLGGARQRQKRLLIFDTDFENFVVAWLAEPPARGDQSTFIGPS
jgi:hypothetical protein